MSGIIFGNSNGGPGGGGGSVTANNGLTLTAGNIQLGGPLVVATNIDTGVMFGFNLGDLTTGKATLSIEPPFSAAFLNAKDGTFTGHVGTEAGQSLIAVVQDSTGNACRVQCSGLPTANSGSIQLSDEINSAGAFYESDYHVNGVAGFGNRWIPDLGYILSILPFGGVVASNKSAGLSSTQNLINFLTPLSNSRLFRIDYGLSFRTGVGSIALSVTYTDTSSTVNTQTFGTLTAVGGGFQSPINIYVLNNTHILIGIVITGTALADVAVSLNELI